MVGVVEVLARAVELMVVEVELTARGREVRHYCCSGLTQMSYFIAVAA
jgi:hypothetical protein